MRIVLAERFFRDVRALSSEQRSALFEVILGLPIALGDPHAHSGAGLRKLHSSGVWEARVGLGLRLVFTFGSDAATLVRVGSHDDVRRYLKNL